MRSPRQWMSGEHNCKHCHEPAVRWAAGEHVCKHHGNMMRDIQGHHKRHRGHNAMPKNMGPKVPKHGRWAT